MRKIDSCPHVDRKHHAHGMCHPCYVRVRNTGTIEPRRVPRTPGVCTHPENPSRCRGVCLPCYRSFVRTGHFVTGRKVLDLEFWVEELDFYIRDWEFLERETGFTRGTIADKLIDAGRSDLVEQISSSGAAAA